MKKPLHSNRNNANVIYGRIPVKSSIETDKALKIIVQHNFGDGELLEMARRKHLPVEYVDIKVLDSMTKNGNHQGVIARVKDYEYSSLDEIIKISKGKKQPLVVILDEISDPHNLGAIIRSCDAFGVDGIIMKSHHQVPINMTVVKVSTGAIDHAKIARVSNISNAIKSLQESGFWIYAADGSGKTKYNEVKYDRPTALIVGSEGEGVSRLVLEHSDFVIQIPMLGHVNSLNVSVATGILLANIRSSK